MPDRPRPQNFNPRSREGSDGLLRNPLVQVSEFQSTLPRRERRRREGVHDGSYMHFNPRSREGSDQSCLVHHFRNRTFQSTLPRRERRFKMYLHKYPYNISIHAPAKGATLILHYVILFDGFQSTLPRRERPLVDAVDVSTYDISIHAPAKGATDARRRRRRKLIFQSTLPRRERPVPPDLQAVRRDFNPRSREGSDYIAVVSGAMTTISIHAPAKGATCSAYVRRNNNRYFNPRSREGSDYALYTQRDYAYQISIHAPAKGATTFLDGYKIEHKFQSTLPRRERP